MSLALPRERNVQSRRFIEFIVAVILTINLSPMSCCPRTSYIATAPGHWVSNLDGKNLGFVVSDTCRKPLLFCLIFVLKKHDPGSLQEICRHMSYVCPRCLCTPWDLAMENL